VGNLYFTPNPPRMPRHRQRARRQEISRLRRELREAEAAGIDVPRVRANLAKSAAQIIAECDAELEAAKRGR
jgi:hypothetical protein